MLVVEDEAAVRLVLARALTRAGWRVLAAETAESALEMLQSSAHSPESQLSVVVSDVVMPGMDGPALVRAVRRIYPGIPAVLVSGYAEPVLRQDLAAADIAFLAKPYATAELLDLVARLVEDAAAVARDASGGGLVLGAVSVLLLFLPNLAECEHMSNRWLAVGRQSGVCAMFACLVKAA